MRRKKQNAEQLELSLELPFGAVARPPRLWEEVEALPLKVEQHQHTRRKAVKPRMRQASWLEHTALSEED